MARKSSRSNKPLEWKFGYVNTTDATVTNFRIVMGLKDDEVAEIHKVMSAILPAGFAAGGADDVVLSSLALSMDPDVIADPALAASQEDLEWFYMHFNDQQIELAATDGAYWAMLSNQQNVDFNPPVLLGTDVGMVVHNDASINCMSWARLFFTRRKATVMELNQVLLKRR